jgi:hypothetical protein
MLSRTTFKATTMFGEGFQAKEFKKLVFFPSTVASTAKMMRMWPREVEICTKGSTSLFPLIKGLFLNPGNTTQPPAQKGLITLYKRVQSTN